MRLRLVDLRCYDNGGKSFDRYTIIPPRWFKEYRNPHNGLWLALGASEHPTHPQGFGQSTEAMPGRHLGKRIPFDSLPPDVQGYVRNAFSEVL